MLPEATVKPALLCLYGLTRTKDPMVDLSAVHGAFGEPRLMAEERGVFRLYYSDLSQVQLDQALLNTQLKDPERAREVILAYDTTVRRLFDVTDFLPFRFGTFVASHDMMDQFLTANREIFLQNLERLSGTAEVSVRLVRFADGPEDHAQLERIRELEGELTNAPKGRQFLLERQLAQLKVRASAAGETAVIDAAREALAACEGVIETADLAIRALEDEPTARVLRNQSVLYRRNTADHLKAALEAFNTEYNAAGVRFDWSGPWPPYSFIRM